MGKFRESGENEGWFENMKCKKCTAEMKERGCVLVFEGDSDNDGKHIVLYQCPKCKEVQLIGER